DGNYAATYAQHLDRVTRLADGMRAELGIGPADRFAVMALNGHRFLELYHVALLGGGVVNPLNLRLAPKELEFILGDSATRVCFVDPPSAPLIERVRAEAAIAKVALVGASAVPPPVGYSDLTQRAPAV